MGRLNLFKRKSQEGSQEKSQEKSAVGVWLGEGDICVSGYTALADCPEVMTGCRILAELIGTLTIQIMKNTDQGDTRIVNELSRVLDINPNHYMTRKTFIEAVVMNLLLYGNGNSIVLPRLYDGYLDSLEPIPANQVSFNPDGYGYTVTVNGQTLRPDEVLHFTLNPDPSYPWKGRGLRVSLKDLADNLKQASATEKAFFKSKWKPSLIVKVDALTDEFSSKSGRQKLLESYVESAQVGEPWLIPAEQFGIEQVKPLSLSDLALADNVKVDRTMVAAILGVPPFVLGVGEFRREAWNNMIQTTVKSIVTGMQQEYTKKLILSPEWYVRFNSLSLLDWDISTIASVYYGAGDRGYVTGNEVRDKLGMSPMDGLDELRVLENYIPYEMSGAQKKLIQEGE